MPSRSGLGREGKPVGKVDVEQVRLAEFRVLLLTDLGFDPLEIAPPGTGVGHGDAVVGSIDPELAVHAIETSALGARIQKRGPHAREQVLRWRRGHGE